MLRLIKQADPLSIIKTACLTLCLCLMFVSCSDHQTVKRKPPKAVNGLLDLSDWDFQKDGVVKLDGEWEFYWEKLLKPDDFNSPGLPQKTGLIHIPSVWNNYEVNGKTLSGNGYATYRLKIRTKSSSDMKALKVHLISTAYTLWLNDEKLLSNGVVGTSKEAMTPFWLPKTASFKSTDKTIQVIVQASNFMFRRGGIRQSIIIGTEKQIRNIREKNLFLELLLLGGLIIMGLYHFGLFVFRRKDPSTLYFGIVCTIIAIRITTTGSHLLNTYVDITWEMTLKLEYLSFYLVIPFFLLFLKSLYPREISRIIVQSSILIAIIFSMIVLFTKAPVHSHTTTAYQMVTLFYIFYSLLALCLAAYKKREGAKLFLLGWLVLIVTVINDILYSQMIIFTGDISPFGFFVFIFFQSYLLSVRFSNSFALSEKLSKEKEEMVLHLEDMIDERTEKLKSAYETIKKISIEDALTGCYNRRYLDEQLPREALRESRYQQIFSVILCDIDFFKKVNDNYGHIAGDSVLITFVAMVTSVIRKDIDWVSRYGGEEFLIVLPGTDLKQASILAERMRGLIEEKLFIFEKGKSSITASFGIAEFKNIKGDIKQDIGAMLKTADKRLYSAKKAGRNCIIGE